MRTNIVVLDLAKAQHFLRTAYVHQAQWPASALLVTFKTFFVFVLRSSRRMGVTP